MYHPEIQSPHCIGTWTLRARCQVQGAWLARRWCSCGPRQLSSRSHSWTGGHESPSMGRACSLICLSPIVDSTSFSRLSDAALQGAECLEPRINCRCFVYCRSDIRRLFTRTNLTRPIPLLGAPRPLLCTCHRATGLMLSDAALEASSLRCSFPQPWEDPKNGSTL